jgi:hypothetical protein
MFTRCKFWRDCCQVLMMNTVVGINIYDDIYNVIVYIYPPTIVFNPGFRILSAPALYSISPTLWHCWDIDRGKGEKGGWGGGGSYQTLAPRAAVVFTETKQTSLLQDETRDGHTVQLSNSSLTCDLLPQNNELTIEGPLS